MHIHPVESDPVMIYPGDFVTLPRLHLASDMAGATESFTIAFVTTYDVPVDGRIVAHLPREFLNVSYPTITSFVANGTDVSEGAKSTSRTGST